MGKRPRVGLLKIFCESSASSPEFKASGVKPVLTRSLLGPLNKTYELKRGEHQQKTFAWVAHCSFADSGLLAYGQLYSRGSKRRPNWRKQF